MEQSGMLPTSIQLVGLSEGLENDEKVLTNG